MSITINGTTNTITAASGLTIAGNTAVTGTLSATGKISTSSSAGGRVISAENNINTNQTQMHVNNTNGRCEIGVLTSGHAYAGSITVGGSFHLYGGNVDLALVTATALTPTADNTYNLGSASLGWKELFCDNGTINTSDARRKTEVSALSAAELNAAKQLAKEIGSFKFLAAVAEKGDAARLHIGMTVQRAIEIMEVNGLNPFAYSFICHDARDQQVVEHPAVEAKAAVLDDDGNVVEPAVEAKDAWTEVTLEAGDKYSFRVHELLLFMAAGFEARLSALEAA